jgi:hypothetical protein
VAPGDDEVVDAHLPLDHLTIATAGTQTVQRVASPRTASRMLSETSASSGRSTIGVSVPS